MKKISKSETCKILGISHSSFDVIYNKGLLGNCYKDESGFYFVEIESVMKLKPLYDAFNNLRENGFLLKAEILEIIGNGNDVLFKSRLELHYSKDYPEYIRKHPFSRYNLYDKRLIDIFSEEVSFEKNSFSVPDICKIYNVDRNFVHRYLDSFINTKLVRKIASKLYIDKSLIPHFENYYKQSQVKQRNYKIVKVDESIVSLLTKSTLVAPLKYEHDGIIFLRASAINKMYGISGHFKPNSISSSRFFFNESYIPQIDVEKIFEIYNSTLSLKEVMDTIKTELNKEVSISILRQCDFEFLLWEHWGLTHKRIYKTDVNKLIELLKKRYLKQDVLYVPSDNKFIRDYLNQSVDSKKHPATYKLFIEYVTSKFINSRAKNKVSEIRRYLYSFETFYNELKKELFLYNDTELENLLLSSIVTKSYISKFMEFVNYTSSHPTTICLYSNKYNYYFFKKDKTIYSREEWQNYIIYLNNVKDHKAKALKTQTYANAWLYCLLLLSLPWRKTDLVYLDGLRLIDSTILQNTINVINDTNIKLELIDEVFSYIKIAYEQSNVNKTKNDNRLMIKKQFRTSTTLAFLISELHRRNNNTGEKLFLSSFSTKTPISVLGDGVCGFNHKKANDTLISSVFEEASKYSDTSHASAYLASNFRRHTVPVSKNSSDSIHYYLESTNPYFDKEEVMYELQNRGFFGWIYKSLVDLYIGNGVISLKNSSVLINSLEEIYGHHIAETISKFTFYYQDKRKSILKELYSTPHKNLEDILLSILSDEMATNLNTYCLNGGKTCEYTYRNERTCILCPACILTNYSLVIVEQELHRLVSLLSSSSGLKEKYLFQISILLSILAESKSSYFNKDKDKFAVFIDFKKIQASLTHLKEIENAD